MKKVTIIAVDDKISNAYKRDIQKFFNNEIIVETKGINDLKNIDSINDANLILISTYSIFRTVKKYAPRNCEIIRIDRTLSKKGYDEIKKLPVGTNALLVNVGPKTTSETISLIYNIGRKDIELFPYYPEITEYPKLDIAITPGEFNIIPDSVKSVIDIGNRVIDISTILDIISNLELEQERYKEKILQYYNETIPVNSGIRNIVTENYKLENQLEMLFDNLNEGIIMYNEDGIIKESSSSAYRLLNYQENGLVGKKMTDVLLLNDNEINGRNTIEKVLKINENDIIASIVPAQNVGLDYGGIAILKRFNDVEKKMHEHRKKVIGKGHRSKYTINNIIGDSCEIRKCKEIAIRMAKSDSSVLIIGENGTGKELFAHVIHNNSNRKDNQFVAVNCPSFPENLLESELFGYEDGAFTGARKGGKEGLFEIAHGGTLFLDEIGEMPLHLQNRLLRTLQEKEVRRIGGDKVMHVDVRIIAATNIDLSKQIKKGLFRKDLYYRLNVLPLSIPPLRDRKEDIFQIFEYYKRKFRGKFTLPDDVKSLFEYYNWDGNVRELVNYIEYFANLNKMVIERKDLPGSIFCKESILEKSNKVIQSEENIIKDILNILYSNYQQKRKIGRKKISLELERKNIYMSEQEVRDKLKLLEHAGYVVIKAGRAGTQITGKGIKHLQEL